mmetsp:Transcript_48538/g.140634  ORF Transcript_48538/g.140634 Transcript_48538/m.140634 type:complete len:435 (-) Transcript_48538:981-2285(-)
MMVPTLGVSVSVFEMKSSHSQPELGRVPPRAGHLARGQEALMHDRVRRGHERLRLRGKVLAQPAKHFPAVGPGPVRQENLALALSPLLAELGGLGEELPQLAVDVVELPPERLHALGDPSARGLHAIPLEKQPAQHVLQDPHQRVGLVAREHHALRRALAQSSLAEVVAQAHLLGARRGPARLCGVGAHGDAHEAAEAVLVGELPVLQSRPAVEQRHAAADEGKHAEPQQRRSGHGRGDGDAQGAEHVASCQARRARAGHRQRVGPCPQDPGQEVGWVRGGCQATAHDVGVHGLQHGAETLRDLDVEDRPLELVAVLPVVAELLPGAELFIELPVCDAGVPIEQPLLERNLLRRPGGAPQAPRRAAAVGALRHGVAGEPADVQPAADVVVRVGLAVGPVEQQRRRGARAQDLNHVPAVARVGRHADAQPEGRAA